MAPARPVARPLSPHLSIWKWHVNMAVSILHRATGVALAVGGVVLFLWWLVAAATGPDAYALFYTVARSWFGILIGVGLTWAFYQHLLSGVRHLYQDTGKGFALDQAKRSAQLVFAGAVLLTLLTWAVIFATKGL